MSSASIRGLGMLMTALNLVPVFAALLNGKLRVYRQRRRAFAHIVAILVIIIIILVVLIILTI